MAMLKSPRCLVTKVIVNLLQGAYALIITAVVFNPLVHNKISQTPAISTTLFKLMNPPIHTSGTTRHKRKVASQFLGYIYNLRKSTRRSL